MDTATISLSLASHTNAGKTTLARTLLGQDVGEVRDEAHVTLESTSHALIESGAGDRLELWDTPGFGDSVRLARRMAGADRPLGWFMDQVWDRLRDRAAWSSQKALRHVLDRSDVVLYLVNTSEAPEEAAYLAAELEVLTLAGKPVVAILNQLGPPRPAAEEARTLQLWRRHLARHPVVREVIPLDAFAGCWVQEASLLEAVERALPASLHDASTRLREAWRERQHQRWRDAMVLLASRLAHAAVDRQPVESAGLGSRIKELAPALGLRPPVASPRQRAMASLATRMDAEVRASNDRLIALHALDGRAVEQVLQTLADHFAAREPLTEGKAALFGGMAAGALAGLKADIVAGGLTLGGGLLAGGVLGALGGAGVARGYNLVRGVSVPTLAWSDLALDEFARAALLGYLAVIHHGRGRGPWTEGATPAFWRSAVDQAMTSRLDEFHATWKALRAAAAGHAPPTDLMLRTSGEVLRTLYSDTPAPALAISRT